VVERERRKKRTKEIERNRRPSVVWKVDISLRHVSPTAWRSILVRPETKLGMLHRYIQAAMGWRDCHLFEFSIDRKTYGIPHPDIGKKVFDARRYTLARLFQKPEGKFAYVYDFGDWWEHDVEIAGQQLAEYRKQYPICVDGAEPCPPEDCGGPDGYNDVRLALRNRSNPRHVEISAWAQSQLYRETFSVQVATWSMRDVQRGFR